MNGNYILLVEDDAGDEALMLHALKKARLMHDVEVVRDGEEALHFIFCEGKYRSRDRLHLPKLVILDLKLPKLSGLEVLRRLRAEESTKHLLVVVLTSSSEEKDIVRSYGLGTNGYVRKSIDLKEFDAAVQQIVLYWLVINEPPRMLPLGKTT